MSETTLIIVGTAEEVRMAREEYAARSGSRAPVVFPCTLEARCELDSLGISYETGETFSRSMSIDSHFSDAFHYARYWYEDAAIRKNAELHLFLARTSYPVMHMNLPHIRNWIYEVIMSLESIGHLFDDHHPSRVVVGKNVHEYTLWPTAQTVLDINAAAFLATRNQIPVSILGGIPQTASVSRIPPDDDLLTKSYAALRRTARKLMLNCRDLSICGRFKSPLVIVTYGDNYLEQALPIYHEYRRKYRDVLLVSLVPLDTNQWKNLARRNIPIMVRQRPEGKFHRENVELGRRAFQSLMRDEAMDRFFRLRNGTRFLPLMAPILERLLTMDIPDTMFDIRQAADCWSRWKPRFIYTPLDIGSRASSWVLPARALGIPTLTSQHGMHGHPTRTYFTLYSSDRMAVWGSAAQSNLCVGMDLEPGDVPVTGSLQIDERWHDPSPLDRNVAFRNLGLDPDAPLCTALFAIFSPDDNYRYAEYSIYKLVLSLSEARPGLQLILRTYPGSVSPALRALVSRTPRALLNPDLGLLELCRMSDVVITQGTSAGIEACAAESPLIYLCGHGEPDWFYFATSGAALGVYRPEDLAPAVLRLLDDKSCRAEQIAQQRRFVKEQLGDIDGNAVQRTYQLIRAMMAERETLGADEYRLTHGGQTGFDDFLDRCDAFRRIKSGQNWKPPAGRWE